MDDMNKIKTKYIFLGKVVRRIYKFDKYSSLFPIVETTETIRREKVAEVFIGIEDRSFKEKEEVYLSELDKYATIEKVTRSTDGCIVCNITYVIDMIEDGKTRKSYKEAQLELEKYLIIEEENKNEKERVERAKIEEEKRIDEKIGKIKDWQNKNPKKVKGIIFHKVPLDNGGRPAARLDNLIECNRKLRMAIPKEYISILSPFEPQIIEIKNKKLFQKLKDITSKENFAIGDVS